MCQPLSVVEPRQAALAHICFRPAAAHTHSGVFFSWLSASHNHTVWCLSRLCSRFSSLLPGLYLAVTLQPHASGFAHYSSTRGSISPSRVQGGSAYSNLKQAVSILPTSWESRYPTNLKVKGICLCPVEAG